MYDLTEAECRALREVVPDHFILANLERRVRLLNRGLSKSTPEADLNRDVLELVAPAHRTFLRDALDRAVAERHSATEMEVKQADTGRWYCMRISPVLEQGAVQGFALHLLDIDDLKQGEVDRARLRAAQSRAGAVVSAGSQDDVQRRLDLMADAIPLLISYVDRNCRYQYNNAAYEHWFSTSRNEMRGRSLEEVLGETAYEKIKGYVESALEGQAVMFEMLIPYKDAGLRHVHAHYVPDLMPTGEVQGFYVLVEDISERREAEIALHQREDELRQLQKMEAMGRLASGIAHEFNNLLQVIQSSCTHMEMVAEKDTVIAEQAARVNRAAQRGISLTRQLLSFSRQSQLNKVPVRLDDLVGDMTSLLEPILGARIRLEVDLRFNACILADPGQIQQVLMNLVINARDAMPEGGRFTIGTEATTISQQEAERHAQLHAGPYVTLTVADTGTGMDEATLMRIFDPFFSTKTSDKGTGLGLSTVYGIVQQLGGYISVQSQPGQGTSFQLYFPVHQAQ